VSDLPAIPVLRGGTLRAIPVAAIRPAPRNPRTDAEATIASLAASLGAGLVQAPIVIAVGDDQYELVDGERRWRAAQAAGHATLTCLVREGGAPGAVLFTQILANLHREDLGPLDESAALKAAWLVLNAHAMGLTDQADAILASAARLRDALAPLRALLERAGWTMHMPRISQAVFIERLGLGMSAAVLKKKLQVLSANDAIQESARQHKLTAAAIRALMTLDPEQQTTLLAAIDADPTLAKAVRSIVQGVRQKGRTIADAIAIAQGRLPDAPPGAAPDAPPGAAPDAPPGAAPARPDLDDMAAMDAVLPLLETAQQITEQIGTLRTLTDGDLARLPAPWGDYLADAMRLIRTALGTLPATWSIG